MRINIHNITFLLINWKTEGCGFVYGMINFIAMTTIALVIMVVNNFIQVTPRNVKIKVDYFP